MNRVECQTLHSKLQSLFAPLSRCAMLTTDFETLYLKYQTLADIATLPQSAEVSHRYLQIQDGDIILTNDPYSGGTVLTSPTLVLGVGNKTTKNQTPAEFLIVSRLTLSPRIADFKNIDDEGLRIPPSPLMMKGELNTPIIDALKSHPAAPPQLIEKIENETQQLLSLRTKLKDYLAAGKISLSKPQIKKFLQETEKAFVRKAEEITGGSQQIEMHVSPTEVIKLNLEHHDGHFNFDFTGTSGGQSLFMTDSTTISVVIGTTLALLNEDIPINSGVFACFNVKAPRGSLLNSTFPRPVLLGHTDGANFLANVVTRALAHLDRKKAWASSGVSHMSYEIAFSQNRIWTDNLPVGAGATLNKSGANAAFVWRSKNSRSSIEDIESRLPIQFVNAGLRANSEGDGLQKGGRGVVRSIKLLDTGELRWSFLSPPHKPEGVLGGKSAAGPEMVLLKNSGEKIDLPCRGQMTLARGDVLTILSSGGGGCGTKA